MRRVILALTIVLAGTGMARATDDPGWPRQYENEGNVLIVYQPQVESWADYDYLALVAAIELTPKGAPGPVYGVLRVHTPTKVDLEGRTVLLAGMKLTEIRFPNLPEDTSETLIHIVGQTLPPSREMVVALDRVLAGLESAEKVREGIAANLAPPPIYRSETPAVLVIFLGEPRYKPVKGTKLQYAINTNWDLFADLETGAHYLRNGRSWLTAPDAVKGPWTAAKGLPGDLAKLPADDNWTDARKAVPGRAAKILPRVFVSTQPAELILTEGEPEYSPIPGTGLLYVTNTDSDLFLNGVDGKHYILLAGRWFRADHLDGPWTSAMSDLPADFGKIPVDHVKGHVLASVPGTDEARDAVMLASIPKKATVKRTEAELIVVYEGEPEFVPIEGTTVKYAVNTPFDVFLVDGRYYCCRQGVWFVAATAKGTWVVCASVPDAIYSIPPTSPKHTVTYVYVYESTPDTVVVGYTSGYTGSYVAAGVLMFGLGYWIGYDQNDDYWHYHCHSNYYSYGCGARYDHYHGAYYRGGSRYYGPYGGAGRGAVYSPYTGAWGRGAYAHGPGGSRYAREAYNPWTNTRGARVGGSNGYQSWGRSAVTRNDEWARAGHRSGPRGTVGGFETSKGAAGVGVRTRYGSGFVARDKNDNLYVGKDGSVYKRSDSGNWQRHENGNWKRVDSSRAGRSGAAGANPRTGTTRTNPRTGSSARSRSSSGLNRSYQSRQRGNSSARRSSSRGRTSSGRSLGGRSYGGRSSGGRSSGGRSGGGRSGGGRSGGGGRR